MTTAIDKAKGGIVTHAELTTQISDEVGAVASALAMCIALDPLEAERRVAQVAPSLAHQLVQEDDDRLSAQTVIDVMCVLWPHGGPEYCGMPEWWQTPLGRACARSLGTDDAESVSHSVAAAMLGVTRGTIAQLVHRGTLDRHPDGGVLRASVMQRLAR